MRIFLFLLILFAPTVGVAQNDSIFNRLQAIQNNSISYYNVDGINFSSETFNYKFTEKDLKKIYRKFSIKKRDVKTKDLDLGHNNFHISKSEEKAAGLVLRDSYYFVENLDGRVTVIWFYAYKPIPKELERKMVSAIVNNNIPESCFNSRNTEMINFAGRELELSDICQWTDVNNIQCPYYGQMNWSSHATKESAEEAITTQLKITENRKGIKKLSEETINIIFEGKPTEALRVVYDLTGATSLLAGMSGGKTLTTYYVSQEVRGKYLSCVLSHWNNDNINESGLPALLEQVMVLKEN